MSLIEMLMQDYIWLPKGGCPKQFRAAILENRLAYSAKEPVSIQKGDKVKTKSGGATFEVISVPVLPPKCDDMYVGLEIQKIGTSFRKTLKRKIAAFKEA